MGCPAVEHAVQNAGASGIRQELSMIADQATRRHMGNNAGLASACGAHLDKLALAGSGQFFDHRTRILVVHIDGGFFDRLHPHAVFFPHDHLWA